MKGEDFKRWREATRLTQQQVADRFSVSRATVQNWESSMTPQAVDMSLQIWESRLRQENPETGPVTLIYSDGPMFINPYGPRKRAAMMHQEPFPKNAGAIARVQLLWNRDGFHNAFIIEESGKPLWNVVELQRIVEGGDDNAPTLVNLLKRAAREIRENSGIFVRGVKSPTQAEIKTRTTAIEAVAGKLEKIADAGHERATKSLQEIDALFSRLLELGTRAPDSIVSGIAAIFAALELDDGKAPLTSPMHYKGFEITWPSPRIDSSKWTVNVGSDRPGLLQLIGGRIAIIDDFHSLDGAIQKAKRIIDSILS